MRAALHPQEGDVDAYKRDLAFALRTIAELEAERDRLEKAHTGIVDARNYFIDRTTEAEAERDRMRAALVECRDEIDDYIRHEYHGDHHISVRCRERDMAANPARIALGESND